MDKQELVTLVSAVLVVLFVIILSLVLNLLVMPFFLMLALSVFNVELSLLMCAALWVVGSTLIKLLFKK